MRGGVRGGAPSFVEFSIGVRSWKAVLSWVEAAVRGGLLLTEKDPTRSLEQNVSAPPAELGWAAMDALLMVMF